MLWRTIGASAAALSVAAARADLTEIIIGRDAAGRLQIRTEGTAPIELDPSVFPGFPGWAEAEPGFESTTLDEPEDDFYIPAAAADLEWILIAAGPGIQVLNETGSGPMAVGETYHLGNPFFDIHPLWHIAGPGPDTFIRIRIHDRAGQYTDSAILELAFTRGGFCYANCDGSTTPPALNVLDFSCFLNAFAAGAEYANCDGSTSPPVLNVLDFGCFLNRFAAGCG